MYDADLLPELTHSPQIKGKMEVMISESGSLTTRLINDSYTVWSSDKSHTSACPSVVPFSIVLPTKFRDYDYLSYPLPPSYDIPHITIPGLFFKTSYILSVTITRRLSHKLRFLTKSKTCVIFCSCARVSLTLLVVSPSDSSTTPERGHGGPFSLPPISCPTSK